MKFSNRTDIIVHALPTQKEDHFSKQQSGLLLAMQIDDDQPQVILIIGRWRCRAGVHRAAAAAVLAPSAQARSEELARISFPTIARNKRSISDCAVTVQDKISLAQ